MNLNPKKCKEMLICPLQHHPDLAPLMVNGVPLEKVSSHKVLGLVIMDNVKWNNNINEIIAKASKRLHIIRVLKRAGVPANDLIHVYYALVRSILEYCCVVWSNNIPEYLREKIELVQKRVMRIVFPGLHYTEALTAANCNRLDERRLKICSKVLKNIREPDSRLHHLLPPTRKDSVTTCIALRNNNSLSLPKCRTDRYKNSFFPAMANS